MMDLEFFVSGYAIISVFSVAGLGISAIESREHYHWTRPFAGFLWPVLSVIAILVVWSSRK